MLLLRNPWATFFSAKSWGSRPVDPIKFEATVFPKVLSDKPFSYVFSYKQAGGGEEPVFQIIKEVLKRGQDVIFDRDEVDACKIAGLDLESAER